MADAAFGSDVAARKLTSRHAVLELLLWLDRLLLSLGLYVGQPIVGVLRWLQALFLDTAEDSAEADGGLPLLFFESSGLFLPYYIGVAKYLREHYDTDHVICAGVSGGYAAASSLALGISPETHWAAIDGMRRHGRRRRLGTFFLSSSDMIHSGYLPLLKRDHPEYLALRARLARGRFWLGATAVWPWPGTSVWVGGDDLSSVKSLCHAATCSMRVLPIFRAPGLLRGSMVFDGFLACRPACLRRHLRLSQGQAAIGKTLTVSAVPSTTASISPSALLGGLSDVVCLPTRATFDQWVARGASDAAAAAERGLFDQAGMRREKRG